MGKRTNLPTIVTLFCDNLGKKLGPAKLINIFSELNILAFFVEKKIYNLEQGLK